MIQQYNAPRYRQSTLRGRPVRVGTVPIGTIVRVQGEYRTFTTRRTLSSSARTVSLPTWDTWIVEAWTNREYPPACKGRPATTYMLGGHLAVVRSLRTGERRTVADWFIRRALDA